MTINFPSEYFNPEHTLECGQVFRYKKFDKGYLVCSADKQAYVYTENGSTFIESKDTDYFHRYFDLDRDYSKIVEKALSFGIPLLSRSAESCKGLRILNQNREETVYSFIVSQNNNIPRIKGIIEKICESCGEKKKGLYGDYYTFPSSAALAAADVSVFRTAGAGYRDEYLCKTSAKIAAEGLEGLENLGAAELKAKLLTYTGIGPKVADCIALFGFNKTDSFPVDTWIEKIYREDFKGELKDRNKISGYFLNLFKEYSGFIQQYLFYGKRLNL